MKNYIIIYHAPAESLADSANQSPEQMEENMKPWMEWAASCGDQLVDLGLPLTNGLKLNEDGSSEASSRDVAGFSIIKAGSMDEAKVLMQGHPHLSWGGGCEIEIHESMALPGA